MGLEERGKTRGGGKREELNRNRPLSGERGRFVEFFFSRKFLHSSKPLIPWIWRTIKGGITWKYFAWFCFYPLSNLGNQGPLLILLELLTDKMISDKDSREFGTLTTRDCYFFPHRDSFRKNVLHQRERIVRIGCALSEHNSLLFSECEFFIIFDWGKDHGGKDHGRDHSKSE